MYAARLILYLFISHRTFVIDVCVWSVNNGICNWVYDERIYIEKNKKKTSLSRTCFQVFRIFSSNFCFLVAVTQKITVPKWQFVGSKNYENCFLFFPQVVSINSTMLSLQFMYGIFETKLHFYLHIVGFVLAWNAQNTRLPKQLKCYEFDTNFVAKLRDFPFATVWLWCCAPELSVGKDVVKFDLIFNFFGCLRHPSIQWFLAVFFNFFLF